MKQPTIEFVNHASVIISYEEISILSDPWFDGTAFDYGWRLIHRLENKYVEDILKKITHIYISHEHPDHFRPTFFTNENIKKILIDRKVEFLFQYTQDKRVINFLKKQGFKVRELHQKYKIKLSNKVQIQIIKSGFYDSLLIFETPDYKILNLNDCPIKETDELIKFKKKFGTFDVLLTQFSYAAWKGGIENRIYRKIAADEKLETVEKQAGILQCKSVIPFASFVYFSNELNFYMNDSINTPQKVVSFFSDKKTNVIFLAPGEIQKINNLQQDKSSLDFWNKKYNDINLIKNDKKDKYNRSISLKDLNLDFEIYKKRIFEKNSKIIIYLLSKIKLMNFFQSLKIKLLDHNKIYKYSIFSGLKEDEENKEFDITMHSNSLSFIFKNEFGFDTLTVNGCFEANQSGFSKVTKSLALGNLNSIGLKLNFGLILHPKIIFLFLNTLKKVKKRIKKM
tara:strand:+ start:6322 stop:7680 length:1359 start_codon:yes stop_codon:yes gene_type:complete